MMCRKITFYLLGLCMLVQLTLALPLAADFSTPTLAAENANNLSAKSVRSLPAISLHDQPHLRQLIDWTTTELLTINNLLIEAAKKVYTNVIEEAKTITDEKYSPELLKEHLTNFELFVEQAEEHKIVGSNLLASIDDIVRAYNATLLENPTDDLKQLQSIMQKYGIEQLNVPIEAHEHDSYMQKAKNIFKYALEDFEKSNKTSNLLQDKLLNCSQFKDEVQEYEYELFDLAAEVYYLIDEYNTTMQENSSAETKLFESLMQKHGILQMDKNSIEDFENFLSKLYVEIQRNIELFSATEKQETKAKLIEWMNELKNETDFPTKIDLFYPKFYGFYWDNE